MAAAPIPNLSASVTRILALTGFPPELKTKDIQAAFGEFDSMNGGFRIKWVDDTSLLLVFNDASVAKRAYLHTILSPPPSLITPFGISNIRIKPYDGADAQTVIFAVNNRRNTRGASISMPNNANGNGHARGASANSAFATAGTSGSIGRAASGTWKNADGSNVNGLSASIPAPQHNSDGGSPTIPNLPTQPTLNALINSSLSDIATPTNKETSPTSAVEPAGNGYITPPGSGPTSATDSTPPRMGDSARRMVGAALGLKHPALTSRRNGDPADSLNKAMGGMIIAE